MGVPLKVDVTGNLVCLQIRGGGFPFFQVIVVCAGKRPKISFPGLIGNPKIRDFSGEAGRRPAEPVLKWSNELKNELEAKVRLTNRGRKYFGQI